MKNQQGLLARHGLYKEDVILKGESLAAKLQSATFNLMKNNGKTFENISEAEFITLLQEASHSIAGPGREMLIYVYGNLKVSHHIN
ncbi:hypothetical protein [Bacillus rubiinfantis]|uniref:hypothetical protein n=1 Tax=Bacillus rubiinfantis TaxID=1499680 RepID=UPI0005A68CCF|nr:hypothetical protein [Bacillus rubiinfantis]